MLEGIVVVIPTRNRADFAERAVISVLGAPSPVPVAVLVSDNSSDSEQASRLEAFCAAQGSATVDVRYVRPPADLSMSTHWEWARTQMSELDGLSHCVYLTDRSVFKPTAFTELAALAQAFPDDVISYDADEIDDVTAPVRLRQSATTGTVVLARSSRLLYLAAQMILVKALPRMLNSLAPIAVLDRVAATYGSAFDSVAPDFCFCFRTLLLLDRVVVCDRALVTMYGTARSNGTATATGIITEDSAEFLRRAAADGALLAGTAIPQVSTNYAIVGREYLRAATERPAGAPPALNLLATRLTVTLETEALAPGDLRDTNMRTLAAEGVRFGRLGHRRRQLAQAVHYLRVLGWVDFAVQSVGRITAGGPKILPDTESALDWAVEHPRTAEPARHLRYLLGAPATAAEV